MSRKDIRDPYAAICLSRLTRILDLDILEDLQDLEDTGNVMKNLELENHWKPNRSFIAKSTEKFNRIISRKGHHNIFGHQLTDEAVHRILPLIDFLKSCVNVEGIFRVPGSKKRQEELKDLIDKDSNLGVKLTSGRFTPHDLASVLKQFLAELPEPLLTHAPHKAYIQVTEINNDQDNSKHKEALQLLFLMIPPENRTLLYYLLDLLNRISNNQESKMTPHNLAVVFSPTILYTKRIKVSCLSHYPDDLDAMNETVAFMITHAKELFKVPEVLKKKVKALENSINKGMEEEVPMSHTFCQQMDNKKHRQTVQDTTSEALISLYSHMMDMPDGPAKQKFLEKFEKVHPGTPPFMPKSRNKVKPSQLTSSTPIMSMYSPGSLARYPLSPINMDIASNSSRQDIPSCKKVAFKSPGPVPSSQKIPFNKYAPYGREIRTPSGLISPCETPQTFGNKSRHRRTSSAGSVDFSTRRKRTRTANGQDPIQTPSGLIAAPQAMDTPSETIMKLYGTPTIRKRITSSDYLGEGE